MAMTRVRFTTAALAALYAPRRIRQDGCLAVRSLSYIEVGQDKPTESVYHDGVFGWNVGREDL